MAEAPPAPAPKGTKDRSPSFPFIPLKTAIERLEAFDKKFGRHPAPAAKAALAWDMKEKSSQGDQTLAALKSYGLIKYDGMGAARHASLTDAGRNYLRAQQESIKKDILKSAALSPKNMRAYWAAWGADRPPDEVALDKLILEGSFSEGGARNFLKVYDDTISYAGLSNSDKLDPEQEGSDDDANDGDGEGTAVKPITPPKPVNPPPLVPQGKVKLMDGERVVFTEESNPQNYLKIVASGDIDETMLEALEDYVKRQKKRLIANFQAGIAQMAASGQKPPRSILGSVGENADAGQVSLMITMAQKDRLREMGYSDSDIANMTPEQAHKLPGIFG